MSLISVVQKSLAHLLLFDFLADTLINAVEKPLKMDWQVGRELQTAVYADKLNCADSVELARNIQLA